MNLNEYAAKTDVTLENTCKKFEKVVFDTDPLADDKDKKNHLKELKFKK